MDLAGFAGIKGNPWDEMEMMRGARLVIKFDRLNVCGSFVLSVNVYPQL